MSALSPATTATAPAIPPARETPIQIRRSTGEKRSRGQELVLTVREMWGARELIQQLVLRDLRVRYQQAVMGFIWALVMPLMVVLSGLLVRVAMATVSGRVLNMQVIGATAVKGLMWAFFSGALGAATGSLLSNKSLFTKLYFPREVLPFSAIMAQTVDTLIGAVALACILPFLGLHASAALLWAPLLVVLLFVMAVAAGLFTSCANLFFRDVKYIVQMFLTFGMFLTPVFYEPSMLGPVGGRLIMLNPISPLLEAMRLVLLEGHDLLTPLVVTNRKGVDVLTWTPWYLLYSASVAIFGLAFSMRIFRRSAIMFAEIA